MHSITVYREAHEIYTTRYRSCSESPCILTAHTGTVCTPHSPRYSNLYGWFISVMGTPISLLGYSQLMTYSSRVVRVIETSRSERATRRTLRGLPSLPGDRFDPSPGRIGETELVVDRDRENCNWKRDLHVYGSLPRTVPSISANRRECRAVADVTKKHWKENFKVIDLSW